jgi:hypothetical protein
MTGNNDSIYNRATHVVASTLGILVGLAGINHGIFEMLQGHVAPNDFMIAAIGPEQRFWEYGLETAFTIVPSFLISGILSIVIGLLVIVWSVDFLDRKYGGGILILLSIILFLVGGGFAPIFMALLAGLTATRINKPLTLWHKILPESVQYFFSRIWLGVLIAFVLVFIISVVIAIFGWPLTSFFDAERSFNFLNNLSFLMLGLMFLSTLTAFAHDIHTISNTYHADHY